MDLSEYDGKYVRLTDKWGETYSGMAEYGNADFLECEYGGKEDGVFIEDCLIYSSQIVSIEEIAEPAVPPPDPTRGITYGAYGAAQIPHG